MSRSNVEILRDMYDAFARGDNDAAIETLAPDIDWQPDPYWPDEDASYRGYFWDRTSEENLRRIRAALEASRGATA